MSRSGEMEKIIDMHMLRAHLGRMEAGATHPLDAMEQESTKVDPVGYIFWTSEIIPDYDEIQSSYPWRTVWTAKQYEFTGRDNFMYEREAFAHAKAACVRAGTSSFRVMKVIHYFSKRSPDRIVRWTPQEVNPLAWLNHGKQAARELIES